MMGTIRPIVVTGLSIFWLCGCDQRGPAASAPPPANQPAPAQAAAAEPAHVAQPPAGMVALDLRYPKPQYIGTQNEKLPPDVEPLPKAPRKPVFAPPGTVNLSHGRPVTSSDSSPVIGSLDQITDGDKEAVDGSFVELGIGRQWVQIDLGRPCELHSVFAWRFHGDPRVYKDVIIQVSDDADFIENVQTIFNNDRDNSAGMGVGTDREFIEHYEGKLIDGKAAKGRHLRLWSNGNTTNDQNHYIEVEVWGRPVD